MSVPQTKTIIQIRPEFGHYVGVVFFPNGVSVRVKSMTAYGAVMMLLERNAKEFGIELDIVRNPRAGDFL